MTQKRFKKLLMSKGYDRNEANKIVKDTIRRGMPYAETYSEIEKILSINISCVTDAFTNAVQQIQKVVAATAKAISAFGETFSEAMKEG